MTQRPWTVYVLVAVSLVGLVVGQIIDAERNLWDVLSAGFALFLAWGMWSGKPWSFSLSFMLASLCLVLTLGATFAQAFLLEMSLSVPLLWTAALSALWVGLLLHPATKAFAGFPSRHQELQG